VGHIKDIGHDPTKATTRLYATHEAQPVHNDSADIVGASPLNFPYCAPSSASCHLRCTRLLLNEPAETERTCHVMPTSVVSVHARLLTSSTCLLQDFCACTMPRRGVTAAG